MMSSSSHQRRLVANRVRSVDASSDANLLLTSRTGSGPTSGKAGSRRLIHSISIIVDPVDSGHATAEGTEADDEDEPEVVEKDNNEDSKESKEEEEEDEEDLPDCLSSQLAKKVFIVDEADKMLLIRATGSASASPIPPASAEPDKLDAQMEESLIEMQEEDQQQDLLVGRNDDEYIEKNSSLRDRRLNSLIASSYDKYNEDSVLNRRCRRQSSSEQSSHGSFGISIEHANPRIAPTAQKQPMSPLRLHNKESEKSPPTSDSQQHHQPPTTTATTGSCNAAYRIHMKSPLGFASQIVSGQDSLELEVRGEREFNEHLRKGSPIDANLLGERLNQHQLYQNQHCHQRQRQSFDYSAISGNESSKAKTGSRRLTLDAGRTIISPIISAKHHLDSTPIETSKKETKKQDIQEQQIARSSRRGRRVSFGNIGEDPYHKAATVSQADPRKFRLSSLVATNEPAPHLLLARGIIPGGLKQSASDKEDILSASASTSADKPELDHAITNQQLENLIKLTRENLIDPNSSTKISNLRSSFGTSSASRKDKRYSISSSINLNPSCEKSPLDLQRVKSGRSQSIAANKSSSLGDKNRLISHHLNYFENLGKEKSVNYKMDDNLSKSQKSNSPEPEIVESSKLLNSTGNEPNDCDGQVESKVTSFLSSPQKSSGKDAAASKSNSSTENNSSNSSNRGSSIESIMANAKLRQEEFARLLEEHEQIVNEINRVETKMSSSQSSLQQQPAPAENTSK